MPKLKWNITACLIIVLCSASVAWALPVFPGAVGHGTQTPAGRGGTVHKVTNLNSSGPGSLRACINASGPRVCVFEVSGSIMIDDWMEIENPYITIAGQTAPSPGITIGGGIFSVKTHDVLVQHMRFRAGDDPDGPLASTRDTIKVVKNGGRGNVVFDHVSVSWSVDENFSVYNEAGTVTFSNSIISESLHRSIHPNGPHGMGGLLGAFASSKVTLINNLFAHNNGRNVRSGAGEMYFSNNVIYNWGNRGTEIFNDRGVTSQNTVIGNVYLRGPSTWDVAPILIQPSGSPRRKWMLEGSKIYLEDNWDERRYDPNDPWAIASNNAGEKVKATSPPVVIPGHDPMPHDQVLDYVVAHVGARPVDRDPVDARVIDSVINRTGSIIDSLDEVGGRPELAENHRPLTVPENPGGDDDGDGYTNLEEWLHDFSALVEGVED